MKKICVIGGSGFIGSRLIENLVKAHKVKILDKQISEKYPELVTECDIRDYKSLVKSLKGFDVIYNLAAEHKDNVQPISLYDEVNVQGSRNICKAASENNINTIIFTSSVAVYGLPEKELDESAPFKPFNDYGRTKMEAELVFQDWYKEKPKRNLVIIRPTVVFGEKNRGNVYNLLNQIIRGKFLMIGKGCNVKSMAYVGNVAAFLKYSLELPQGSHIFNYIDKPDFNMNSLLQVINDELKLNMNLSFRIPYWLGSLGGKAFDFLSFILRKELPISSIRVKKFCANTHFGSINIGKIKFKAPYSIEEGLKRTLKAEFKDV